LEPEQRRALGGLDGDLVVVSATAAADADTSIPTDDGLYRIWREGEAPPLEYIGQSSNLKSRLYRHRRNRHEALLFSYSELGITMSNTSAKRLRRSLSAFTGWKLGRVHKISSGCHTPLPS